MLCQKCGTQVPDRANYCWKCGKPVRPGIKETEEERWETCEVVYQNGENNESSCFAAKAIGLYGVYIFGTSSAFHSTQDPDHRNNDHTAKLDLLINRLVEAGWELVPDHGPDWWNHRFRRRIPSAPAK